MKRIVILTCAILIPLAASACHTIQGAGQDVTAVGKGMESATK
ncbi:MAG: entericidin [Asticcacaulis sp.]|nr:entericidin [Asticcacaulis sp.]